MNLMPEPTELAKKIRHYPKEGEHLHVRKEREKWIQN